MNNSDDAGGPTRFGISLRFLKSIKPDANIRDIESLSMIEAEDIYERKFWQPMRLQEVNSQKLATRLLDLSVNTGMRETILIWQRALNDIHPGICNIDGIIGIRTISATNGQYEPSLYDRLILEATKYYNEISKIVHNSQFLDSWLLRLNDTP